MRTFWGIVFGTLIGFGIGQATLANHRISEVQKQISVLQETVNKIAK